jgi:lipoprotein-releasing system permease protein
MLGALLVSAPVAAMLLGLVVTLFVHPYAGRIGWRYLRSKKRQTVSVITFIAVGGVALGVAALLAVISITSGFQDEFRDKVLGVNAHVLVMKYGLDFEEYRDVIERAREMPEVSGAAPFLINEMLIGRGERTTAVLVKGVDPELMPSVLDLPSQMVQGNLRGLRAVGARAPVRPEDLLEAPADDWSWLEELAEDDGSIPQAPPPVRLEAGSDGAGSDGAGSDGAGSDGAGSDGAASDEAASAGSGPDDVVELPTVEVPTPEQAEGAIAQGTEPALPSDELLDQYFEEERLILEETPVESLPGMIVGRLLAQDLGLGVGDRVQLVSPLAGLDTSMVDGNRGSTPRSGEFRVIGIFEAGFQEYDSRLVYVDLYAAQHLFDHGDSVTGVELRLHDLEQAPTVARRLERVLGGGPYHTMDWQELNRNLFTALEIQKVMLSLVIGAIILVAAFNVIATLIMVVLEKKREIAILKAMGARNFGVLLIFMIQGLLIGVVGTALGVVLGGGVVWYLERFEFPLDPHVYLIDHLPVRSSAAELITTVAIALGICILATVIPSAWAARLLPADGVRYE